MNCKKSVHNAGFYTNTSHSTSVRRQDVCSRREESQASLPHRNGGKKSSSNNSSFNHFNNLSTVKNSLKCHRRNCSICCKPNYMPLDSDVIKRLDEPNYFNSISNSELTKFKQRYNLERDHALHRGPKPKWLTQLKLCSNPHEAVLRSYDKPPEIVIQRYNSYALTHNLPLVPSDYDPKRSEREQLAKHKHQRRILGLDVPEKQGFKSSVFQWTVGYRFNEHAHRYEHFRSASVRFPLANHVIMHYAHDLTVNFDLREYISTLSTQATLSVGSQVYFKSLRSLVGDSFSIITATYECVTCVQQLRMLPQLDCTNSQTMRVTVRSHSRLLLMTPTTARQLTRNTPQDYNFDWTYLDTSEPDWGPALFSGANRRFVADDLA